jgi:hypothetical protein
MLIVIALIIGLVGGWIYAGCPLPRRAVRSSDGLEPLAGDVAVSPAPAPGASPALP